MPVQPLRFIGTMVLYNADQGRFGRRSFQWGVGVRESQGGEGGHWRSFKFDETLYVGVFFRKKIKGSFPCKFEAEFQGCFFFSK